MSKLERQIAQSARAGAIPTIFKYIRTCTYVLANIAPDTQCGVAVWMQKLKYIIMPHRSRYDGHAWVEAKRPVAPCFNVKSLLFDLKLLNNHRRHATLHFSDSSLCR